MGSMEMRTAQRWDVPRAAGAAALCLLLATALLFVRPRTTCMEQALVKQAAIPTPTPTRLVMQTVIAQPGGSGVLRPGGTPMEFPSRASWELMQADPRLPERNASLLQEFESAPWLLPAHTPALPYAGVHDLEELLALRATPMGRYNKTITLLTFNEKVARPTQNTIYSMVKLGGVRNYIVGTWNASDLEACAAMNLPCADLSPWLPDAMDNEPGAGDFGTHDYLVISWLRAVVVAHLIRQGYVVYQTDTDVAYVNKPIWESFLAFLEEAGADAAFQAEETGVNIGSYVILPTPAATTFISEWAASASSAIQAKQQDQFFLPNLQHLYELCATPGSCLAKRTELADGQKALFRTFLPSFWSYSPDICSLANPDTMPLVDTCDWQVLFFHPVCMADYQVKTGLMKRQGVWFMDEDSCHANTTWAACQPLRWQQPALERHLYACPEYHLALVHQRPQREQERPAVQEVDVAVVWGS